MDNIFKLNYISQPKIWGSEDWLISAHKNGDAKLIVNGKEERFSDFYKNNKSLFGINDEEFPLLVKIIDAKEDLSIQVHPNDEYALKNENSLGKTECWYILESKKNTDIIVGIDCKNASELDHAITTNKTNSILTRKTIKAGDFLYIPAGCVHAICGGTKLLEIQQSSDVTYRLYDYDRPGDNGLPRELHIKQSLAVIDYNYKFVETRKTITTNNKIKVENLVTGPYFYVDKYSIKDTFTIHGNSKFKILVALEPLTINGLTLDPENAVIILKETDIEIKGNTSFIISSVTE